MQKPSCYCADSMLLKITMVSPPTPSVFMTSVTQRSAQSSRPQIQDQPCSEDRNIACGNSMIQISWESKVDSGYFMSIRRTEEKISPREVFSWGRFNDPLSQKLARFKRRRPISARREILFPESRKIHQNRTKSLMLIGQQGIIRVTQSRSMHVHLVSCEISKRKKQSRAFLLLLLMLPDKLHRLCDETPFIGCFLNPEQKNRSQRWLLGARKNTITFFQLTFRLHGLTSCRRAVRADKDCWSAYVAVALRA